MRYLTLIICFSLTFFIQVSAQSTPPSGTEVVIPWATSFYAGKGARNVSFLDSLNGVCYSKDTPFYGVTTDGGNTWRDGKVSAQLDKINLMHSIGKDSLVALRDSQDVFHSYDGGESWIHVSSLTSSEKAGYGIFFNRLYGVLFPAEGGVLISEDMGRTWTAQPWQFDAVVSNPVYSDGYLFALEYDPSIIGFVFSRDNGQNWEKMNTPLGVGRISAAGKSKSGFHVTGWNNRFYLLTLTGQVINWYESLGQGLNLVYNYVSDDEVWSLDHSGWGNRELRRFSFLTSTDTVFPLAINSMYLDRLFSISRDKIVAFSASGSGSLGLFVFHRNGFRNIRLDQLELPGRVEGKSIFFVNESKGFAGTVNGGILVTTDGGNTWKESARPDLPGVVTRFVQRSESEFIAICQAGLILESSDGGSSWQAIISPFKKGIVSAAFAGRDTIFFCSEDSLFMTTPRWQHITPVNSGFTGGYFSDLAFYGYQNGSALYNSIGGSTGKSLVTTNGGHSWEQKNFTAQPATFDPATFGLTSYYDPTESMRKFTLYYEGSDGLWLTNTGSTGFWQTGTVSQKEGGLLAFSYSNKHFYSNLGDSHNLYRIDLGANYTPVQTAVGDENSAYLLVKGGRIFKLSRSSVAPPPSQVLRSAPVDGSPWEFHSTIFKWEEPWSVSPIIEYNIQLALGDTSNIVENINAVTTRSYLINLTADSSIYFWRIRAKNSNGWGNFNKWYTFRSSVFANEPQAWQTPIGNSLSAATILSDGCVVVGDSLGKIARTDSPPDNWTIVNSTTTFPMYRFWRNPNNNYIFANTWGNGFFYSDDRGVTWRRRDAPFGGGTMFHSLTASPTNYYFGVGQFGTIYRGVWNNSNIIWTNICFSPYTGSNLAIDTWGENGIAAVGELGSVIISTDGGGSFSYIPLDRVETFQKVGFAPDGTLVILNQNGERRVSTDMGQTWAFEFFETRALIRDMVTQDGISVLIDKLGGIYTSLSPTDKWRYSKLPDGYTALGVNLADNKILLPAQNGKLFYMPLINGNPATAKEKSVATEFNLAQNYPNPFNSSTVITFSIKTPGSYTIEVFTALGERMITIYDGWLEAGEHRINFDSKTLANGIYLYRLRGSQVNLTKKMIILK